MNENHIKKTHFTIKISVVKAIETKDSILNIRIQDDT